MKINTDSWHYKLNAWMFTWSITSGEPDNICEYIGYTAITLFICIGVGGIIGTFALLAFLIYGAAFMGAPYIMGPVTVLLVIGAIGHFAPKIKLFEKICKKVDYVKRDDM